MTQKVLKVGDSAAVVIPKDMLKKLGLKPGDKVEVEFDAREGKMEVASARSLSSDNMKIAKLTANFINRYRKDLENLARK